MSAIRCITFDLDDTLWDCDPVIARAEWIFYEWIEAQLPALGARFSEDELREHRRRHAQANPDIRHDLTRLRKLWLAALAAEHGYPPVLAEAGFRVFWEHRNAVHLYDEAAATLARLGARYRLGAITNAGFECVAIAEHSRLAREFRHRLFSKIVPNVKSLGLLHSEKQRRRFHELDILQYEHETTSDVDQDIAEEQRMRSGEIAQPTA